MSARDGDVRIEVREADLPWGEFETGESIAVNGVCLTATAVYDNGFAADVSNETLQVTTLNQLIVGSAVNLEPAIQVGERLGGHLVSGHIDCVGRISQVTADARSRCFRIEVPAEFARYIAKKGSVSVDGVSLTTNAVSGNAFQVNIIPHTLSVTTIGNYAVGTEVNIEVDQMARYAERLLNHDDSGISIDFLQGHGYA